nr:hypothetical protein [Tanacetum cinerariifolium]
MVCVGSLEWGRSFGYGHVPQKDSDLRSYSSTLPETFGYEIGSLIYKDKYHSMEAAALTEEPFLSMNGRLTEPETSTHMYDFHIMIIFLNELFVHFIGHEKEIPFLAPKHIGNATIAYQKDVVFDGAFGGVRDEEVVIGEGAVVISSSLDMLTNSCLGGIMVSLIFLEGLDEEALLEFM